MPKFSSLLSIGRSVAHWRQPERRHWWHPHSTHRRLWWGRGIPSSSHSWHRWCWQSKWEQLGVHILEIIENIVSLIIKQDTTNFHIRGNLLRYLLSNYIFLLLLLSFLLILCFNSVLDKLIYLACILSDKL